MWESAIGQKNELISSIAEVATRARKSSCLSDMPYVLWTIQATPTTNRRNKTIAFDKKVKA